MFHELTQVQTEEKKYQIYSQSGKKVVAYSKEMAHALLQYEASRAMQPETQIALHTEINVNVQQEIEALQTTIRLLDCLYEETTPLITDSEYDYLYSELQELERINPTFIQASSPTQRITTELSSNLEKIRHTTSILSLDKITTIEGIQKFWTQAASESVILQRKEDGLTIVGSAENGQWVSFVTRGNGELGEIVTESVSQIVNIPQTLHFKGRLEVRFEIIVPYSEFERINVDGKYSNPRNLAAGTVRSLDSSLSKERGLRGIVIDVIHAEGIDFTTDMEKMEFAENLGLEVSPSYIFTPEQAEQLYTYVTKYDEEVRPTIDHMIDGLVIKFNRLSIRKNLGNTAKHPRWAIAYKFSSKDATTRLNDVLFQIGKSGQITPVAEFKEVQIDNVTIRRATLHNFKNIKEKDIRVGDEIFVTRSNDVIPQVVKANELVRTGTEREVTPPPYCPECGKATSFIGENLYCTNRQCEPQIVGRLEHFISREAMNVEGIGEKLIAELYYQEFIRTPADIYRIAQHKDALLRLDGYGQKKYEKMLAGIEESKNQPLHNVLYSLSINLIGRTASKALAKQYGTMQDILNAAQNRTAFHESLQSIPDFGEKMFDELFMYLSNKETLAIIEDLLSVGLTMKSTLKTPTGQSRFSGMTFVITGSLSKERKLFVEEIEGNGGKVSSSVSKKTTYLLMAEDAVGTSKHQKALELGVPILYEADYNALQKA